MKHHITINTDEDAINFVKNYYGRLHGKLPSYITNQIERIWKKANDIRKSDY